MPLSTDNGNGTDDVTVADNGNYDADDAGEDDDDDDENENENENEKSSDDDFFLFFNEAKAYSIAVVFCYSLLNLYDDDVKMTKKTMFNNTYHINLMQTFI